MITDKKPENSTYADIFRKFKGMNEKEKLGISKSTLNL